MKNQLTKSNILSPLWALMIGLVALPGSVFLLWRLWGYIDSGKIISLGKSSYRPIVLLKDNPHEFWFQVGGHAFCKLSLFLGSVSFLIYGFRKLRKNKTKTELNSKDHITT
jgi:hypothetical protein